jgi:hypothetical protein
MQCGAALEGGIGLPFYDPNMIQPSVYATPVTLTTHVQLAGLCTTICWLPVLVCGVTDCPDPAVSLTAAEFPGAEPAGTTYTANAAPDTGGGEQL